MHQDIINIDLKLPTKWEDLTDKQLRYLFGLLSLNFPSQQVKTYCLFRWSGMQVMHRYGKGWYCKFAKDEFRTRNSGCASAILNKFRLHSTCTEFVIFAPQINAAITSLDWIDTLPTMPVRITRIGRHRAVPADFEGVPFETFIVCDNLYQGYLTTKQDNLLDELAAHLYDTQRIKLTAAERVSVFYWFASLKGFLAKVFRHFFQPVGNASGADGNMIEHGGSQYEMLQNAVNAQIRALTKGDITKESEVLSLDTWRALTELDAQAREYEELNKQYPTK